MPHCYMPVADCRMVTCYRLVGQACPHCGRGTPSQFVASGSFGGSFGGHSIEGMDLPVLDLPEAETDRAGMTQVRTHNFSHIQGLTQGHRCLNPYWQVEMPIDMGPLGGPPSMLSPSASTIGYSEVPRARKSSEGSKSQSERYKLNISDSNDPP